MSGARRVQAADATGPRRARSDGCSPYTLKPAAPGQTIKFFVGPKEFDDLQVLGPDYVRAIDFGMFAWLVVPLLGA